MIIEDLDITRIAHSCFKIITRNQKIIYFDPFQIQSGEKADYIFISHEHYDHCSVADIRKIIKDTTIIVTVPDCQSKLSGMPVKEVKLVNPGDKFSLIHFDVYVTPAYNLNKQFHMRENSWVGFVLKIDGKTIYHIGDSDVVPEMKDYKGLDVIFVPVSGQTVMNASEAAQLVNFLKPKTAIPMHYGAILGTQQDAETFKSLVQGVNVVIL